MTPKISQGLKLTLNIFLLNINCHSFYLFKFVISRNIDTFITFADCCVCIW